MGLKPAFKKILVIKIRSMGDTVLMTASLQALTRAFPEAKLHVLVASEWSSLLESNPRIDKVWRYERHRDAKSRAKALAKMAIRLRREQFDCVVNLHASPSSALLAFATGAKTRSIHFHGHKDRNRFSTVTVPDKGKLKPVIERDLDAIRALGLEIPTGLMPRVEVDRKSLNEAKEILGKTTLPRPLLILGLGSSRPTKSWPLDRFVSTAIRFCRETGGTAIALTGPGETSLSQDFLKTVDDVLTSQEMDLPTRSALRLRIGHQHALPLPLVSAVMSQADLFLGNDSGPKHLAVALGIGTVTLFGPEDPFEWHPYPQALHPYFFIEGLKCRRDAMPGMPPWCGLEVCVEEEHKCMKMIGTEAVLQKCIELLNSKK